MPHYLNLHEPTCCTTVGSHVPTVESGALRRLSARLGRLLWTWDQRYRQRRQLRELPASLLRDIGINAAEARLEASKPFWIA